MQHTPARSATRLPVPDDDAQAHSLRLIEQLRSAIQQAGGRISFADYMERVLYAPGLGYYSAGSRKFGADGDFVTAPEISPLFSRCLATQVAEILRELGGGDVLEIGAGSGSMAAEILLALEQQGCLPERYGILERGAELRDRQQHTLQRLTPHLLSRVQWLDALPESGFVGVMLANELLDALPVQVFEITAAGLQECFVGLDGERFVWRIAEPTSAQIAARLGGVLTELAPGYRSEVNLTADAWIASLGQSLARGVILLLDYGFPQREYYHPERQAGTLMCHYRHHAHADPFLYPGLQDITAHVDFTAIAEAALQAGLSVNGYNTQGYFLLATGITELAETGELAQQLRRAQQIRTLTMPEEMGELFKVMALGRGYDAPLRGFSLQDLRSRL